MTSQTEPSWCRITSGDTAEATFRFTIDNFKNRPEKLKEGVKSTSFKMNGPGDLKTKWQLKIVKRLGLGLGTWDLGPWTLDLGPGNRIENRESRIKNRESKLRPVPVLTVKCPGPPPTHPPLTFNHEGVL